MDTVAPVLMPFTSRDVLSFLLLHKAVGLDQCELIWVGIRTVYFSGVQPGNAIMNEWNNEYMVDWKIWQIHFQITIGQGVWNVVLFLEYIELP